jgi:hypothetical protein
MPQRLNVLPGRPTYADSFAQRPANFAASPEDEVDSFSEILSGVKLNGAVFFSAEFSAPWGFSTPTSTAIVDELAPGTEHLVLYHFLIDGGAIVQMREFGQPPGRYRSDHRNSHSRSVPE